MDNSKSVRLYFFGKKYDLKLEIDRNLNNTYKTKALRKIDRNNLPDS